MSYDIVLVDGSSVAHAAHRTTKLNARGIETQAIFGTIRTLAETKVKYPKARFVFCWDGHSERRYALYPGYKSNRDDSADKLQQRATYQAAKPWIHKALSALGVPQLHYADLEADDLAGYMAGKYRGRSDVRLLLLTGDQDWLQLLAPNIDWCDHRKDQYVKLEQLMNFSGFPTPHTFLEGKCLTGDTSDTIKGVGGIGDKGAPEFIAEFGSVFRFWRLVESGDYKPLKKAHLGLASPEGKALFRRNLALMQLLQVPAPNPALRIGYPQTLDRDAFLALCHELNFLSITRRFDAFMAPFEEKA